MKVVLYGASGYAGGHIARELRERGHEVVGVARGVMPTADDASPVVQADLFDTEELRRLVADADVLALAVHSLMDDGRKLVDYVPTLLQVAKEAGVRLAMVGGAGSTWEDESRTVRHLMHDEFLEEWRPSGWANVETLEALENSGTDVDWFVLSPAGLFGAYAPGERTGHYRVGGDVLLRDEQGKSFISGEDYAIAFVDELENPRHHQRRFHVAY